MWRQALETFIGRIAGDFGQMDRRRHSVDADLIAEILPYRVYDRRRKLFFNRDSTGFIVEFSTFLGADEKVVSILTEFLSEAVPEGTHFQIINWASPRVGHILDRWLKPRCDAGGIYADLARHRVDHLRRGAWSSLSRHAPFFLRGFRAFIAVSVEGADDGARLDDLLSLRDGLLANLVSLGTETVVLDPLRLIGFLDEILNISSTTLPRPADYSPHDPIHAQIVRPDTALQVRPGGLFIETVTEAECSAFEDRADSAAAGWNAEAFDVRCFSVPKLPAEWAQWKTTRLIGDLFNDQLRLPCPVLTVLCISYPDRAAAETRARMKSLRSTQQAGTPFAKYNPALQDIADDWQFAETRLAEGEKLVRAAYFVVAFAKEGRGDTVERSLRSLYKASGWALARERFVQLPSFAAALPFTLADGLSADLAIMHRMQTRLTGTCVNIAPVQGEYLGQLEPHLLFVGRRGQPFFWSPFGNDSGNHNVAVLGASGSGKSVLIQELVASLRGAGSRVFVIDDGRSFEHSSKFQGGTFVEFRLGARLCINPFSMVDGERARSDNDYRTEVLELLKLTVLQMCRSSAAASDSEKGLIEAAVVSVWNEHGTAGTIDRVAEFLDSLKDDTQARDLYRSLVPYTSKGAYGEYFNGPASVALDNDLMVFEMAELDSKRDLRSVVLLAIMFLINTAMHREGRARKKALVIDESWALLGDGATGEFIEGFARRCRKYGGALITATQSVNDFYKSAGARAAYENSDWVLILSQKSESIAELKKSGRVRVDRYLEELLESLRVSDGEFSEVVIHGPAGSHIGRLVLDPFSATLYSSSPETFAAIEYRLGLGQDLAGAVRSVAGRETRP